MFLSMRDKLRGAFQRAGSYLKSRWQKLRDQPDLSIPAVDTAIKVDTLELKPPRKFDAQLREVAALEHSAEPLSGQTHSRSCLPMIGSWFSRRRDYLVYTPADYVEGEPLPVVVVLHGCRQTDDDIRAISGFDAIAERERFIVVYPFVTGYLSLRNKNCWAWWMKQHIQAGSGEVEDIGRIIKQVQEEFSVDPKRIHITGLSSGAGMTVAALVAHGSLFASGASVAGVAYDETARAVKTVSFLSVHYRSLGLIVKRMRDQITLNGHGRLAPLLVIQSEADETVPLQAGLNLRDSWLAFKEINPAEVTMLADTTRGINWQYQHYGEFGTDKSVDFLTVDQLSHGWIGGLPGSYSDTRGPNISEVIWLYFNR
ncbi:PHB depolymerase family esterase [Cocleimonas sp. KMM 6892]|uniref:extracellular catalytic domain type 1 short-chain-length polyhydroxyalkanoate depolymerase n=1 Tax=unclassified Cocleimonas TaxID=2639732 RepID=UPI002DBF33CE|nr:MULTISPECIES: PHB depolymerase family esterase [unclassified Cocleimonas]MEB8433235.1 PHB depolymerase family esterase [Cocleimonas sp. KMM 6892]MEC4715784.1 PHB depolymerase family esterase [Cocleimonas sp. KMM 6895]MEC4745245.1 PHB depolymerase family esterase [Cocleimonas sp. KMM 6896]